MAGYLFTLDSIDSLHQCAENGVYGTFIQEPHHGNWSGAAEGTFADYATMTPGDNVYFFIDRRIYGIGELVRVGPSCRYENFPGASSPIAVDYPEARDRMLNDELRVPDGGRARLQRWVCTFKPSPHFFTQGVDMDDALSSNPAAFRMLRAIWKLSFIKFSDEENQAFRDVLLRANQSAIREPRVHVSVFEDASAAAHGRLFEKVSAGRHDLQVEPMLNACSEGKALRHEMALEAGILFQLASGDPELTAALGHWDYLSHQVVASPFKPIDYMDKMDLFGYSFIPGHHPTISRFLVGELKREVAGIAEVEQTMRYVDWVKDEYAHGDYAAIRAYLVARTFSPGTSDYVAEFARRMYTVQRRPARSEEWTSLRLLQYRYDFGTGRIVLRPVTIESVTSISVSGV